MRFYRSTASSILAFLMVHGLLQAQNTGYRRTLSLNGVWQIAEGSMDMVPQKFEHHVPVPGLVSLAVPSFRNVAPKTDDRKSLVQTDPLRDAFWYRRTFMVYGQIPATAVLQIAKCKYGTKVFMNGKEVGIHLPCFTPGYFNVKKELKKGSNEIIVRVGASRSAVPSSIPDGFDFEKERYIPGIYDNVSLILCGTPHIERVQTAPDIRGKRVLVQLVLSGIKAGGAPLQFTVREAKTGKFVARIYKKVQLPPGDEDTVLTYLSLHSCHLWSPEDPFLYSLDIATGGDETVTRFGMREFHFDTTTKKGILNGKPYFLRGSNITMYRFFEDSACDGLPWNEVWVRKLFKSFKRFHWNSLRFCIGFPPEEWYRIADEEGFLIQDEFPIWYGGTGWNSWPAQLHADELEKEFTEWMQDHWNHPSVVIWDASNETVCSNGKTDETGEAVRKVRSLDLSRRPWDNSYSQSRAPGDVFESHPYHFQNPKFQLKDIAHASPVPQGNNYPNTGRYPVVINEYGWLWLNRDGSPTTLTKELYDNLLGKNASVGQRRHLYAMYTAAETEFWRCHRNAAAVMQFTALGYSRSDGQTSDNFLDPARLLYDSEFVKYVPESFSPVGIMLDEWGKAIDTGTPHRFNMIAINDLQSPWSGTVHLQIVRGNKVIVDKSARLALPGYGQKKTAITFPTLVKPGKYTVQAVLEKTGAIPVRSVREIEFK